MPQYRNQTGGAYAPLFRYWRCREAASGDPNAVGKNRSSVRTSAVLLVGDVRTPRRPVPSLVTTRAEAPPTVPLAPRDTSTATTLAGCWLRSGPSRELVLRRARETRAGATSGSSVNSPASASASRQRQLPRSCGKPACLQPTITPTSYTTSWDLTDCKALTGKGEPMTLVTCDDFGCS